MGCHNSKISIEEKIETEIKLSELQVSEVKEIKEIPISNEIKKLNIKVNIIRPNPMNTFEDNKKLRIKIPSKKISF